MNFFLLLMKDFLLQVKIKNNKLQRLMSSRGIESVAELCRRTGISQAIVGKISNLKQHPVSRFGISKSYLKLAEFFNVEVEDLWPGDLMEALSTNRAEREIDSEMFLLEWGNNNNKDPETLMIEHEEQEGFEQVLADALQKLPEKSHQVLELLYGLNGNKKHTLEQAGEILGVTKERIRQRKFGALRALHNWDGRQLRRFYED